MAGSNTQTAQALPIGQYFGLPGYTEEFEQYENLQGVVTTMAQSAPAPFAPQASLQKTDVVYWWEMESFWTETVTYSAGVLANSPEAPGNILQQPKLKLQGQYTPIECESGFDMEFFQFIRPMRGKGQRNVQDLMSANPVPSTGFPNQAIPQANLAAATLATSYVSPATITSYPFIMEWPAGIYLDEYWDIAIDGTLLPNAQGVVAPMAAFVSPQYMGGGERVVVPQFNVAAGVAATYDQGPLAATTALTVTGFSGNFTVNMRRVGVYSSDDVRELPPIFNWQYRRASRRINIGSVTKYDLPITEYGQVMLVYARIFDPTLGTNSVGGYYNVSQITKCQVLFGSNLPRFDDDVPAMQNRFIQQHGFLPPQGTVVWDLIASRRTDRLTNSRSLNTLTNANCKVHIEASPAPGASAYAVLGVELLVPVSKQ
jgi:hypothetical protein